MTKDSSKLAYALLDYYVNNYKAKYGRAPLINRHREKWAMNDIIESVGYDRALELINYYFKINTNHDMKWFIYNFDRLDDMLRKIEEDNVWRAKIRHATKVALEGEE